MGYRITTGKSPIPDPRAPFRPSDQMPRNPFTDGANEIVTIGSVIQRFCFFFFPCSTPFSFSNPLTNLESDLQQYKSDKFSIQGEELVPSSYNA